MTFSEFWGLLAQTPANGNIVYAQALYAQAKLETANFTSNIYKEHNNMFGMRPAKIRTKFYDSIYQSANGEFASYASVNYSMIDRVDLDMYNNTPLPLSVGDVKSYYNTIVKKGYCPDPNYANQCMVIFQKSSQEDGGIDLSPEDQLELENEISTSSMTSGKFQLIGLIIVVVLCVFGYKWYKKRNR